LCVAHCKFRAICAGDAPAIRRPEPDQTFIKELLTKRRWLAAKRGCDPVEARRLACAFALTWLE